METIPEESPIQSTCLTLSILVFSFYHINLHNKPRDLERIPSIYQKRTGALRS